MCPKAVQWHLGRGFIFAFVIQSDRGAAASYLMHVPLTWIILKIWCYYEKQKLSVRWDRTPDCSRTTQWLNFIFTLTWGQISVKHVDFLQLPLAAWNPDPPPLYNEQVEKEIGAKANQYLLFCHFMGHWCLVVWHHFRLWTWRDREGSRRGRRSEQTQEMVALRVVLLSAQLYHRLWQAFWLQDSFFIPCLPASLLLVPICQIGLNTYTSCTRLHPNCAVDVSYCLDHLTLPDSHKVKYQPQIWCCTQKCFSPVGIDGIQFFDSDEACHLT